MSVRATAVAGRFYPNDPAVLRGDILSYLSPDQQKTSALGCLVPHAGLIYSGSIAGSVFARIEIPESCIILCPNHTGLGRPLAIMSEGEWQTPLGKLPINGELAEKLKREFSPLSEDAEAHYAEHSIEVELPFLQVLRPDVSIVPIALGTSQLEILEGLGKAIARTVEDSGGNVLIIASSDMNHYESDTLTRIKDKKAIDQILALDFRGLFEVVKRESISMCGYGPAVTMLAAVVKLGAVSAELTKYATSADVSGDRGMVVGYAGIVIR